ncbi:MAG: hypothetical protein ACM4AI_22925 [Acidobacteriota bacterium]
MAVKLDPTSVDAAEARLDFFLGAPSIVGGGVGKARAEAARLATLDAYRGAMAKAKIAEHEKDNLGRLSAVSGQHLAPGEAALRRFLTLTPADPARQSNGRGGP